MMKLPCNLQNRKVRHMIQKGKGGWVTLCFEHDTIWRFNLHNLKQVPALEYTERTQMEDLVKPNWNSPTHSAQLFNAGSTSEESGENLELVKDSLTSSTLTSLSSSLSTSSNSWSSSIKRSIHQYWGRSLSSLEKAYWEESDSEESESSNSTLSSDVEEEYGNPLRVLTNAFVNFLEQAQ